MKWDKSMFLNIFKLFKGDWGGNALSSGGYMGQE